MKRSVCSALSLAGCWLGLLTGVAVQPRALAQQDPQGRGPATSVESTEARGTPQREAPLDTGEYAGVVTGQTLTSTGYAFFTRFSEQWGQLEDVDALVLLVRERPSPRGGTEVEVFNGEAVLLKTQLPRSYGAAVSLAERAVEFARQKVLESKLQSMVFNDPDLARSGY